MWPHIAIIYMNCNSQNAIYKNCKSQTACIELINCNWSIFPSCYKFLILFPAVVVPGNGCFSLFSSTPPLIAHSQSNLQFQFTKAIAIQLYFRQITLFCQFKLFNIGLQSSLIYLLAKNFHFYCRRIQNKAVIYTKHIPIRRTL